MSGYQYHGVSDEIGDVIGVNLNEVLPKPQLVDEIIGFVTEEAAKLQALLPEFR